MEKKIIKLFLRYSLATAFLSAVADRLGMWNEEVSVWGNWNNFLDYSQIINPWFPPAVIPTIGVIVTALEIILAVFLIIGLRTEMTAKISGYLLLIFAISMTFSTGIKGVFDYSVFTASAGAFALSLLKEKYLEIDSLLFKKSSINY